MFWRESRPNVLGHEGEIKTEGVPWLLVVILTVILAFFGTVWQALLPASLVSANSLAAVAWVLKYLTLRIGGSKAYEEIGSPLAGGVLVGCMAFILIGGLMGATRFFIPF